MELRHSMSVLIPRSFLIFLLVSLFFFLLLLSACTQEQPIEEIKIPDADQDGIEDTLDECSTTPLLEPVGKQGCSARELRESALSLLQAVPTDTLTKKEKEMLAFAIANITQTLDPSLFNEQQDLSCTTIKPFVFAQMHAVRLLENLSCIVDDAVLVNATEEENHYIVVFKKKKVGKVVINASDDAEAQFFEYPSVTCPQVLQVPAGQALEKVLSAHFVFANVGYQKMTCEQEDAKTGALRNLGNSIENYNMGRYQHIVDNLGLAWGYVHACECGDPFQL